MRLEIAILALTIFSACNLADEKNSQLAKDSSHLKIDTFPSNEDNNKVSKTELYDSLTKVFIDTSNLRGKRQWIMNHFLVENGPSSPAYDTLFDLTYDGYKDYVICYYGQSGTGIKNRVNVYIFNTKNHCYILNQHLSELYNPTFYTKHKKITWFYIANGGGEGGRLEWINNSWIATKEFQVANEGDNSKWKIKYPLKNKTETKIKPYQMIPSDEILETTIKY